MQIIYAGKTTTCYSRGVTFPSGFCVSLNPKHWSNEEETLKLINKIIHSYLVKKCAEMNLVEDRKALVVWDVYRGQVTEKVKDSLLHLMVCLFLCLLI